MQVLYWLLAFQVLPKTKIFKNNLNFFFIFIGATALYPVYNLMNSFCTCNTRVSIEENQGYNIVVRAQTYIKKGQQITTRYLPPWEGQPKRVDQLWKHWQFICHCPRCKDPSEFGTYFSAIKYDIWRRFCAPLLNSFFLGVKSVIWTVIGFPCIPTKSPVPGYVTNVSGK